MEFNKRWGELPSMKDREQIKFVVWNLQREEGAWGMIMARVNVRVDHKANLVSIGLLPGGELTFGFNMEMFKAINYEAQKEVIELSVHKILNGQLSSVGRRIRETYGEQAAEMGLLCCLTGNVRHIKDSNGKVTDVPGINIRNLVLEGFHVPTPKEYKLEEGRHWEYYAAQFSKMFRGGQAPNLAKEIPHSKEELQSMDGLVLPSDSSIDEPSDPMADQVIKSLVNSVDRQYDIKGRGIVAGEGVETVEALFKPPQVSWQDKLRIKEEGAGKTWRVLDKRKLPRRGEPPNFFGRRKVGMCRTLVLMDTSGSRQAKHIAAAYPEMRAMKYRGSDVWLCQVDAAVQNVKEFRGEEYEFEIFGRGGTTIQPAIDQYDEICHLAGVDNFDLIVFFTDGFTDQLDFGEHNAIVMLDSDGADITKYGEMVKGENVELAVLDIDAAHSNEI